jgi:hypothetical protein
MPGIGLILFTVLYIIWWPINQILRGTIFVLTPVWTLVSFILLPFIHLTQALINVTTFPFRGEWLDRIEVGQTPFNYKLQGLT